MRMTEHGCNMNSKYNVTSHIATGHPNFHFRWEILIYVLFVSVFSEVKTGNIFDKIFMRVFIFFSLNSGTCPIT